MSQDKGLARLGHLLENLPESIPHCDLGSTHETFSVSGDEIEELTAHMDK